MNSRYRVMIRMLLMTVLIALVAAGARLRASRADTDTEEALIIAGASLAGYVVLVGIGTAIVYPRAVGLEIRARSSAPADEARTQQILRWGPWCPSETGTVPLLCWK
jgi:hypothetical protein